ncbi:MAG: DUF6174 domain-containing protein [Hellea sp.]
MRINAIALLFFALAACQSAPKAVPKNTPSDKSALTEKQRITLRSEMKSQHELWKKSKPIHYKYAISQICFCLYDYDFGPNEIEVKNGQIVRRVYRGPRQDDIKTGEELPVGSGISHSIEEVFEIVDKILVPQITTSQYTSQRPEETLTIKYDNTYGFPNMVSHTKSSNLPNSSTLLYIMNFEPL